MDQDGLIVGQLAAVGLIHGGLLLALLWINRHYDEVPFFLRGTWWHPISIRVGVALLTGFLAVGASLWASQASGVFTLMAINAGLLTLWYLELGILLGRRFFPRVFDNEVPAEISLFVAFVLATNGGYFTLMLIGALFRARSL